MHRPVDQNIRVNESNKLKVFVFILNLIKTKLFEGADPGAFLIAVYLVWLTDGRWPSHVLAPTATLYDHFVVQ